MIITALILFTITMNKGMIGQQTCFINRFDNHLTMQPERKPEDPNPTKKSLDRFSIFLITKNAQNSYGVKTGDYMRYRRYCTRKVEKLRKVMDYKYGNRTKFVKKDIALDKAEDKRILQVGLFMAENKFNESIKEKKSNKLRAKFMAVKKFKRAHLWSQKLLKLTENRADHVTVSEAEAYSYYLQGIMYLEKQDWKTAQKKLIACKLILSNLLANIDTMNAKVYREKIDQVDQTIKFCNFKISKGQEIPIEQIIEMLKNGDQTIEMLLGTIAERELKEMSLDSAKQIRFGNERYPIEDTKIIETKSNIDIKLQNLQIIKKKVLQESTDQQLFEQLLNFFSSAIISVDSAIKMADAHKQNVKQHTQGEVAIYKKISLLLEQIKFNILIDRNNMIFKHSFLNADKDSKKGAPQNLAKLLSNTISIYSQYVELEKAKSEGAEGMDPERIRAVDAKIFYYRTLRLYFVGQVYYNNEKIKEAYSLWQECERCLESVKNSQQESIKSQLDLIPLGDVSAKLKENKLRCIIKNYKSTEAGKQKLSNEMQQLNLQDPKTKQQQNQFTLYELMTGQASSQKKMGLAEYSMLTPIDMPGKVQPLPTRPIFYDIFQSTIQYPTLADKVQQGWFSKLFKR